MISYCEYILNRLRKRFEDRKPHSNLFGKYKSHAAAVIKHLDGKPSRGKAVIFISRAMSEHLEKYYTCRRCYENCKQKDF